MLSYVPDDAKVKQKMMYSATRNNLSSELGQSNFIDYIHGTQKDEFSVKGYRQYYESKTSEVPLSEQEKARKEEREQEVNTVVELVKVKEQSTGPGQSNVVFPVDDTVPEAISCFSSGQFNYIRLIIDQKKERILLDEACIVSTNDLKDKVPNHDCSFHFYKWNHVHEGQTIDSLIFVFSTPDGSNGTKPAPVRSRMLYAASKQHVITMSGLNIDCKIEIGNGVELSESEFKLLIHPPVAEEKAGFKKPLPKGRKTGTK